MKKFSKTAYEALEEDREKLIEAISEFNTAREALIDHLSEVETLRDDLKSKITDALGDMETFSDEKSDKWKESDAGTQFESWRELWQDLEGNLDGLDCNDTSQDLDEPDELPPSDSAEC